MTDWGEWDDQLADFWENTTGYHEGYLSHDQMQEFIQETEDLFWIGWGPDVDDADARQAARDAFFEFMAEYDLDVSLFDWDDWRDWYASA